jgi:hypothetical protein
MSSAVAGGTIYHADFRLSITKALSDQLADALDHLKPVALTLENIEALEPRDGVYQLYRNGKFVYVGKTDNTLPIRLSEHYQKLSGRKNISIQEMEFTCLYVDEDFTALAPEQLLIKRHKKEGDIPWNNCGFGNHDPGRQRDTTVLNADHFDVLFPIDVDRIVAGLKPGTHLLGDLLTSYRSLLPFTFRFDDARKSPEAKRTYATTRVTVPDAELTAAEVFALIARELPENWQIAVFLGYAIMYPDNQSNYPSAWRYYRKTMALDVQPKLRNAKAKKKNSAALPGPREVG